MAPVSTPAPRVAETVALRDGSRALVRPIDPGDKDRLHRGFHALSARSRTSRFLGPMDDLDPGLLAHLTEVDHAGHEALIALRLDGDPGAAGGDLLGVARYVRLDMEHDVAEVAVVVADSWQGRGLATEMLRRLVGRARANRIARFTATAFAENAAVLGLLREAGCHRSRELDGGRLIELEIDLPCQDRAEGLGDQLASSLRAAASGGIATEPWRVLKRRVPGSRARRGAA